MNKLLTKIVGVALGATMAIGVGVGLAVGNANGNVIPAKATTSDNISVNSLTGLKSASNSTWKSGDVSGTGATYYLRSMGANNTEEMRWNANAMLASTASKNNEYIESVSVVSTNKTLNVYGSNSAYAGSYSTKVPADSRGTSIGTLTSSSVSLSFGNNNYKYVLIHGSDSATDVGTITITYKQASQDPSVTIANSGSSTRMLNKNGGSLTIDGISASGEHLGNTPYYVWSITNKNNCNAALANDNKLHTSAPTITASTTGNFDLGVAVYDEEGGNKLTEASTPLNVVVKEYGGNISWTSRSSLTFKEGVGFDYSTTTITTTMNDGSVINYGGDYSNMHLYSGDTEVDYNAVDATYCSTSRTYKLYDSEHNAWSTAGSATTLTFLAGATIEESGSFGSISEIEVGQKLYLYCEASETGWGGNVTYSSKNEAIATVDGEGTVVGVATGSTKIDMTLENGTSVSFDVTISSSVTFLPSVMRQIYVDFGWDSSDNQYRYHTLTKSNGDVYYRTAGFYKDGYLYESSAMTGNDRVQLYGTATYLNGTKATDLVEGAYVTAKSVGYCYYNGAEFNTYSIESVVAPSATALTITGGANEVYKGRSLTFGVTYTPTTASDALTWSVTPSSGTTINNGTFSASNSGTYTIRVEVTNNTGVYAEKTVNVYELQEVVVATKASPKTTYYVGQTVEDDLLTATVKFKCGSTLNYKTENVTSTIEDVAYTYGGVSLTNGNQFGSKNESGAVLAVSSLFVTSSIYPEDSGIIALEPENVTVSNVKVYDIEIDFENSTITPTITTFSFGSEFTHDGTIHVVYKNGYGSRDVSLKDESVDVTTPNMKVLGKQTITVTIEDDNIDDIVELGSYEITITNVDSSAGGSSSQNLETSTSNTGLSANSEKKRDLSSKISSVTSVTLTFKAEITGNTGTSYTHGITFKLYDSSNALVATSSQISVATTAISNGTWSTTLNFNTPIEVAAASYTLTSKASSSNVRVRSFDITVVNTIPNFASDQVTAFANYFLAQTTGYCDETISNDVLTNLKTEYDAMVKDARDTFAGQTIKRGKGVTYTTVEEEAFNRYINMIEDRSYSNFLGLSDDVLPANPNPFNTASTGNNNVPIVVVVISVLSLTTISGYFLLRKKKEEK